jgi:hypothetical protein
MKRLPLGIVGLIVLFVIFTERLINQQKGLNIRGLCMYLQRLG